MLSESSICGIRYCGMYFYCCLLVGPHDPGIGCERRGNVTSGTLLAVIPSSRGFVICSFSAPCGGIGSAVYYMSPAASKNRQFHCPRLLLRAEMDTCCPVMI